AVTSAERTITVDKGTQATLTVDDPGKKTYSPNGTFTLTATGGTGDGAVTFELVGMWSDVAKVDSDGTVTIWNAGTFTVIAKKAASSDGNYAATKSAPRAITIGKADQADVTITAPSEKTFGDRPFQVSASGGNGTGKIVLSLKDGSKGTLNTNKSGSSVTITGAGTITVVATREGDRNYNEATAVEFTITVKKAEQWGFGIKRVGDQIYAPNKTLSLETYGGIQNGAVTFALTEDEASTGTVSADGTVTITGAGWIYVTATKEGDDDYNPATASIAIKVNKGWQKDFAITDPGVQTYSPDGTFTLSTTGGNGDGAVTFALSWNRRSTGTVSSDGIVTIKGAGTIYITATKAEDDNYNKATASIEIKVKPADQTGFAITNSTLMTYGDQPFTISTTGGQGDGQVMRYDVKGAGWAWGNKVTITSAGTIEVTAFKAGDKNYNATKATLSITVQQATPAVSLTANPGDGQGAYGDTVTLTATVSKVGVGETPSGKVTFKQDGKVIGERQLNGGQASIAVSGLNAGDYDFAVDYSGSNNYNANSGSLPGYTLNKAKQAPVNAVPPGSIIYGQSGKLWATGGTAGEFVFNVFPNPYLSVDANGFFNAKGATPNGVTVKVSVYRTETANYLQSDTAWFSITVQRDVVKPPVAKTDLVENGKEQVGVPTGNGYFVLDGSATKAGTYTSKVVPDDNHRWENGSIDPIDIVWEIKAAEAPAAKPSSKAKSSTPKASEQGEIILVEEFIPLTDLDYVAFAKLRTPTKDTATLYEAKLVHSITGAEYMLAEEQTYLLELVDPATQAVQYVLLREYEDGTFDCVLVNVDINDIVYPVTDFSLYGVAANEVYIEGVEPNVDVDLNGWVYWVWTLDNAELILRIENQK
ncbi:MAG: Ig-like domain-containing protein, partial [Oscillospiraceae bacterium]|nr:Ig-like domain-containing protein [Oscillospiraceae bacterium]